MTTPKECLRFQDMFSAWSDHELDTKTISMLQGHVNSCADCSSEWKSFQKTVQWLNEVEPASAPSGMLTGIHEKLEQKNLFLRLIEQFKQARPINLSLSAAAAAIVVALLTVTLMKTNYGGPANNPALPEKIVIAENTHTVETPEAVPASSETPTTTDQKTESSQPAGHPEVPPRSVVNRQFAKAPFHIHPPAMVESMAPSAGRQPEAGVGFVSLGPDRGAPGKHSIKANPYSGHRLTPDIMVTVNAGAPEQYADLFHKLMDSEKWQARLLKDDVLLIILKNEELPGLRQILTSRDAVFSPDEMQTENSKTSKKILMVTVRLQ
ncbi:MAG: zf-HC2 domain-containing protein [Desulfobulbaceae bacterium]|nr:zf-HC2 domain-containing protein [Desulfobulbaceae bacterium]MCK5436928.1 zf-HC2 domain-containing protein [Desulfobulbaceae bacterium]